MKKLFIVLGMLLVVTSMFAQTNTVAVVPFDYKGVSSDDAETITEIFTSEYAAASSITVVDRVNFEKIKEQMKFELTDWSNNEKIAQLGKALNANLVLCGQVRTVGNKISLNVRVINVNTTAIVSSSTGYTSELVGLLDEIPVMVKKMTMKSTYKIGDIGPGGGYIFYVSEVAFPVHQPDGSSKMCKYLEVSPLELGQYTWCSCGGNSLCNVSTSDGLGAGVVNTSNILKTKHRNGISISNCAAYACLEYYTGTTKQGEWYLPSKIELDLLYRNLRDKIINTGSSGCHWSSSEYDGKYAWDQRFSDGNQYYNPKGYTLSVRAIRAF